MDRLRRSRQLPVMPAVQGVRLWLGSQAARDGPNRDDLQAVAKDAGRKGQGGSVTHEQIAIAYMDNYTSGYGWRSVVQLKCCDMMARRLDRKGFLLGLSGYTARGRYQIYELGGRPYLCRVTIDNIDIFLTGCVHEQGAPKRHTEGFERWSKAKTPTSPCNSAAKSIFKTPLAM